MTEGGDTGIQPKPLCKHFLDILGADGVELGVVRSFSYDDDRLAFADFTMLML